MHKPDAEGTPPNRITLAADILSAYKILTKIQSLCENPHWTASRRWKIADYARQAQAFLEGSSNA